MFPKVNIIFSCVTPGAPSKFNPFNLSIMFHKLRCRLAKRRFEKALDNVTEAEFKRMCAMQQWFETTRLVPGDKVTITFNEFFGVEQFSAENRLDIINVPKNDLNEFDQ